MAIAEAVEPKTDDLITAVRTLDKAYNRWVKSSNDDQFPEYLATACGCLACVVTTGFPSDDRLTSLYIAAIGLATAYQSVLEEEPGSERRLLVSIESVVKFLDSIDAEESAPPQSVASMLAEWKAAPLRYQWIARAFGEYDADADKWLGPFFNGSGSPRADLIEKEAANPGSVLGDGYKPLSQRLKAEKLRASAMKKLEGLQAGLFRPEGGAVAEKATVLEMLQEGQFPDVVSRIKRVSLNEVLDIARANGITIQSRDDILSRAAAESNVDPIAEARGYVRPQFDDAEDFSEVDDADDDDQPFDVDTTEDTDLLDLESEPVHTPGKITSEELSEFVLNYLAENEDASQHDILAAAVTTTGKDVSRQMLTPILKKIRGVS